MLDLQLKLQKFEGPFELLLELIDKKELPINEVSLAEVADQYLEYVKGAERFSRGEVSSFIATAATLMLLKSRSLMPSLQLSGDEEEEIEDLKKQLQLYQCFMQIAKNLEKIFGKKVILGREPFLQVENIFLEPKNVSVESMWENVGDVIGEYQVVERTAFPEVSVKRVVSLKEKINNIRERLEKNLRICFVDMLNEEKGDKVDLIVNFLAILELVKRGFVEIRQNERYGDIEISAMDKDPELPDLAD